MKSKSILFGALAILILAAVAFAGARIAGRNYQYQGSLFEPFPPAYEFTLHDAGGRPFTLAQQRGKVVLLFFGYANCPDVCPTTLADFKRIRQELGDRADEVEFVFITIDPERDTPEQIEKYVHAFDPSFIGLSGTEAELAPVWDGYFVVRQVVESDSAAGYLMEHSARIYLVDQDGRLRLTFPFGMTVEAMTADILHILSEVE